MGKSSKPVIGYQYLMTIQMGLCTGPVDALRKILGDKKLMWSGSITSSSSVQISKAALYGGEKKEGGVQGQLDVCMGEATQAPNAKLLSLLGTPLPAFRGLCTLVFDGMVGAMNPYIKPWAFQVQRFIAGWRTDVWQPSLCQINDGANGAHIIYRAITDPVTGLGRDPSALDLDRMLEAAQTLYNEGLGLCLRWTRSDVLSNFVQVVNNHCGAMFVDDPTTGKQYMKLLRGDYDIDTVPLLDESNVMDIGSAEEAALSGTVNQVTVTYHDSATNKDAAVTVQNTANIALQGRVVEQANSYPGIWNHDLAVRTAMRDLKAVSSLPWRFQGLKVQATDALRGVRKGDVVAFSWKDLNIVKMPLRILEIQRGGPTSHAITFTAAQDVYSLPDQTYVVVQPSLWTEPDLDPHPVAAQLLVEASYRDLATQMRDADLAQLDTTSCFVGALGVRPTSSAFGYDLWTRIGASGDFTEVGAGAFAPTGLLQSAMPREVGPTAVTLTNGVDLDQVQVGSEALVDGELCRVTAIDPVAATCTLARGCVDTVQAAHVAGARVWFTDLHVGADPTEYATGETINAQLLTRAGNGTLDPADATIASVQLDGRQARPYPPANVQVNSVSEPTSVTAPVTVSWVRRNRLTQADQLVDASAADIAPETGQTTTVEFYDSGNTLVHSEASLAGLSASAWTPGATGNFTIKAYSVRDGLSSMATYALPLEIVVPAGTDPYWSSVFSLLPMSGTDGSTTFTDKITARVWTPTGDAKISTATSPFTDPAYNSSGSFGTGYLTIGSLGDFKFLHDGSTPWTIDVWVKVNTLGANRSIFGNNKGSSSNVGVGAWIDATGHARFFMTAPSVVVDWTSSAALFTAGGAWQLVSIQFDPSGNTGKGVLKYFLGGNLVATVNGAGGFSASNPSFALNLAALGGGVLPLGGNLSNFRVSKILRYGGSFTPPTAPFPTHG